MLARAQIRTLPRSAQRQGTSAHARVREKCSLQYVQGTLPIVAFGRRTTESHQSSNPSLFQWLQPTEEEAQILVFARSVIALACP